LHADCKDQGGIYLKNSPPSLIEFSTLLLRDPFRGSARTGNVRRCQTGHPHRTSRRHVTLFTPQQRNASLITKKSEHIDFKRNEDVYRENDTVLHANGGAIRSYEKGTCISQSGTTFEISENRTKHRPNFRCNSALTKEDSETVPRCVLAPMQAKKKQRTPKNPRSGRSHLVRRKRHLVPVPSASGSTGHVITRDSKWPDGSNRPG
jgi:hypothetical protein